MKLLTIQQVPQCICSFAVNFKQFKIQILNTDRLEGLAPLVLRTVFWTRTGQIEISKPDQISISVKALSNI